MVESFFKVWLNNGSGALQSATKNPIFSGALQSATKYR
jgi:hypothetical protein